LPERKSIRADAATALTKSAKNSGRYSCETAYSRKADHSIPLLPKSVRGLKKPDYPDFGATRKAIMENVENSCGATLAVALDIQSKHAAGTNRNFILAGSCHW
jgi:hypothetical protein